VLREVFEGVGAGVVGMGGIDEPSILKDPKPKGNAAIDGVEEDAPDNDDDDDDDDDNDDDDDDDAEAIEYRADRKLTSRERWSHQRLT
jgi:hypothetical protein